MNGCKRIFLGEYRGVRCPHLTAGNSINWCQARTPDTTGVFRQMIDIDDPIEYPVDGTLDLHQFAPEDTKEVVLEYILACLEQKIYSIRIVHGKGKGVKREIVLAVLQNHSNVVQFRHEGGSGGSWGATVVDLRE